MKQIVSNYSYSPTINCVTLTGLNIDQDQLLLVVAPGVGRTLYNFASITGSVVAGTNTRINLTASTAGLTTTSPLVIYYDDQSAAQSVTGTVALDPASLISLENITVTVGSSVSISNFPSSQTIAGTVTANLTTDSLTNLQGGIASDDGGVEPSLGVQLGFYDPVLDAYNTVKQSNPLPVSGTVTANLSSELFDDIAFSGSATKKLAVQIYDSGGNAIGDNYLPIYAPDTLPISGTVTISNAITASQFYTVVTSGNLGIPLSTGATSSVFQTGTDYDFVIIRIDSAVSGVTAPSVIINTGDSAGSAANPSGNRYGGFYRAWNDTEKTIFNFNSTNIYSAVTKSNKTLIFPSPNKENRYFWLNVIGTFGSVPIGSVDFYACKGLAPQVATDIADGLMMAGKVQVAGNVWVSNSSITIGSLPTISGTVTANVTNSVTIGSLPVQLSTTTIGGTSRLNVTLSSATTVGATAPSYGNLFGGSDGTNFRAILTDTSGRTVVTVSNFPSTQPVSLASLPSLAAGTAQIGSVTASISGTVPVSGTFYQATQPVSIASLPASTVTVSSIPAISGTVTANVASTTVTVSALPNGALTTRFGSVTTASVAQLTSCVTNTSRKYLLAQNISAGTVTIGIGFSPTTTQGIQLTAGAGLTFDAFCPTGAVYWLGATTGANWTILEG